MSQSQIDGAHVCESPDPFIDFAVDYRRQIVGHDHGIREEAASTEILIRSVNRNPAWMASSSHIARDHRHNDLGQTGSKFVSLQHERRRPFRSAQVGIWKQNENDVAAFTAHRKHSFRVVLNLPRMASVGLADRPPAPAKCQRLPVRPTHVRLRTSPGPRRFSLQEVHRSDEPRRFHRCLPPSVTPLMNSNCPRQTRQLSTVVA